MFEASTRNTVLIDVSQAQNSARACQMVEDFLVDWVSQPQPSQEPMVLDVNAGSLFLTRGVVSKIQQLVKRFEVKLGTVYTTVPQTQQAALDEGCFVKGQMEVEAKPIRMPLPVDGQDFFAGVALPDFSEGRKPLVKPYAESPRKEAPPVESSLTPSSVEPVKEQVLNLDEIVFEPEEELPAAELPPITEGSGLETLYVRQTLRSGHTVRFAGNVIIVGDAHAGSEIVADGDILVWGELKGIAHAGAQGNYRAEIRAMKIEALQLRIADYIARRPDRIFYHKQTGMPGSLGPEVAKVADGEIKIMKSRGFKQ